MARVKLTRMQFLQKRVLIPFWTLEWLLEVGVILFVTTVLYQIWPRSYENLYDLYTALAFSDDGGPRIASLLMAFPSIFLILRIVPVVLFSLNRLPPWGYFAFELPQVLIWAPVWIWSGATVYNEDGANALLTLCAALQALYIGSAIYSCVMFHRYRIWTRQDSSSNLSTGAFIQADPEMLLTRREPVPRRYASAPIVVDDDEDEEVPVSPRHSILPSYDEAQLDNSPRGSFIDIHEKPKASRTF